MKKFNLLNIKKGLRRDLSARSQVTLADRALSSEFGFDYFDGSRKHGYGGYKYDGRWIEVSKRAVSHFKLRPGSKVLDVGCGKGFFVHDLTQSCGLEAFGVDISEYAIKNCMPEIAGRVNLADMRSLAFPDNSFDAVFCINTLHNLTKVEAFLAIREMNRIVKNSKNIFIQVDAYTDEASLSVFETWVLTANLYMKPEKWLSFFEESGFEGSYYWTILLADGSVE